MANNSTEFCFRCNHCLACVDQPSSFDCAHHVFRKAPNAVCYVCSGSNETVKLRAALTKIAFYFGDTGIPDDVHVTNIAREALGIDLL